VGKTLQGLCAFIPLSLCFLWVFGGGVWFLFGGCCGWVVFLVGGWGGGVVRGFWGFFYSWPPFFYACALLRAHCRTLWGFSRSYRSQVSDLPSRLARGVNPVLFDLFARPTHISRFVVSLFPGAAGRRCSNLNYTYMFLSGGLSLT